MDHNHKNLIVSTALKTRGSSPTTTRMSTMMIAKCIRRVIMGKMQILINKKGWVKLYL